MVCERAPKQEVTMANKQITLDPTYLWEARGSPTISRAPSCDPPKTKKIKLASTYSWKALGTKRGKKKAASRKRPA
jgi:hypothetical protein